MGCAAAIHAGYPADSPAAQSAADQEADESCTADQAAAAGREADDWEVAAAD